MSSNDENLLNESTKEFTYFTQALNQLLETLGCDEKHWSLIYCLIGISEGEIEFAASDIEVASRLIIQKGSIKIESLKKRVQRQRQSFIKWQDEKALTLIYCRPGYKDVATGTLVKTTYELKILFYIQKIIEIAKTNTLWEYEPIHYIRKATEEVIKQEGIEALDIPYVKNYKRPSERVINQKLRTARSLVEGLFNNFEELENREDYEQLKKIKELLNNYKPAEDETPKGIDLSEFRRRQKGEPEP